MISLFCPYPSARAHPLNEMKYQGFLHSREQRRERFSRLAGIIRDGQAERPRFRQRLGTGPGASDRQDFLIRSFGSDRGPPSNDVEPLPLRRPPGRVGRKGLGEEVGAAFGEAGQRGFRPPAASAGTAASTAACQRSCGMALSRLLGRHDADVMLGERHIDEHAALRAVEPANANCASAARWPAERADALGRPASAAPTAASRPRLRQWRPAAGRYRCAGPKGR